MSFLSRIFSRAQSAPLPSLEDLLAEKGIPRDLPGLEELLPDFEHHEAEGREAWVDALAELHQAGHPLPGLWVDAQYDLLPQIAPTWKCEREGFFFRPFVEGLSQRVIAGGKVMPEAWLTLWGISEEEVLDRSLEQLRDKSKGHPFQRLAAGIYQSTYGDGFDAARMLLPELWKDLFPGQNIFIAVPTHNQLFVSPQVLLPKLVEAIDGALTEDENRLFATIFQVVDSNILPANLQDPHPMAQPQREFRQSDILHAYRVQEEDLDPALGVPGPVGMMRTQQGRAISYTVWTPGAPFLLPETDMIVFSDQKKKPLGMYLRQTLPRIGELKGTAIDIWGPRRVRYEGFPTTDQLARLDCAANAEQVLEIFKTTQAPGRPAVAPAVPPQAPRTASPVPDHLRGLNLGVQSKED